MNVKKRDIPIQIRRLEALSRRLIKNHPTYPKVNENLQRQRAGYQGEKAIDYYLQYLPKEEYLVLHGLRLFDGVGYFQIDYLIISKSFILVIEVKNIIGTLLFDPEFNQCIRINKDKEEGFKDPILQVERQKKQLKKWVSTNSSYTDIPIISLVVISNPSTIIKATSKKSQISQKVIHSSKLLSKIDDFHQLHPKPILSLKEIKKLADKIVKQNEIYTTNVLESYGLVNSDLISGVFCQACFTVPINRIYGAWKCPSCSTVSKTAHIVAIEDYALLINTIITNQDAREYLGISSPFVVNRLLKSLKLPCIGDNKARQYRLKSLVD